MVFVVCLLNFCLLTANYLWLLMASDQTFIQSMLESTIIGTCPNTFSYLSPFLNSTPCYTDNSTYQSNIVLHKLIGQDQSNDMRSRSHTLPTTLQIPDSIPNRKFSCNRQTSNTFLMNNNQFVLQASFQCPSSSKSHINSDL